MIATLRGAARGILDAAIAAGDARRLTRAALEGGPEAPGAGRGGLSPGDARHIVVVGAGKAAAAMVAAAEEVLGERIASGLVAVKDAHGSRPGRVRVVEAGHPLPDARGEAAATEMLRLAAGAGADDVVLCLVSGGGSALAAAPVPGLSLGDKQRVTRLLLEAGAPINDLNAVRKHLSRLKGGQLARAAAPATVVSLLLSDVIGDPLDVIGSGPTAPDPTTFADALGALDRFAVRSRLPAAAREHLEAGARGERAETPKPGDPLFGRVTNRVIGNNELLVAAAAAEATRRGYAPLVLTRSLQGEAREVARAFVAILEEVARSGRPVARPACVIAAGETTVTVRGPGTGGRCQEFGLALAERLAALPGAVVLAAGSDGTDGPTDAAGVVVDSTTIARARARGLDAGAALSANDAYPFFAALGDLIRTGNTDTNLMDLYVGVVGGATTRSP